jgi:osmoprotectant transport system substrate-binding protein
LVVASLLVACAACRGGPGQQSRSNGISDEAITVGSFNFAESTTVAEIYSEALERRHYPVTRAFDLGPREFVSPALSTGLVQLVPEYAGTAVQFMSLGSTAAVADAAATHDALVRSIASRPLTALDPAPAQSANTFVVSRALADRLHLRTLSDAAAVAPELSLGGPPECPNRPTCLLGLEQTYGWKVKQFIPLDAGGPVTLQALHEGAIDVALLFTTDPAIDDEDLVQLTDDRHLQPAENVTPILRTEVVSRWGHGVVDVLDEVSMHLTTDELRGLNRRVAHGTSVSVAAAEWLSAEGVS